MRKPSGVEVASEKIMYLFALLFLGGIVLSQPPDEPVKADTVYLDELIISAPQWKRVDLQQPVRLYRVDTTAYALSSAGGLNNLLRQYTPVFVRDYGPGGVGTISHRGMAAHQTQVYWYGFPLNHAMLGLTDLSIIPTGSIDRVQVSGVGSSMLGSGSMSGSIHLSQSQQKDRISVTQRMGSFGNFGTDITSGFRLGDLRLQLAAGLERSQNDFTYEDVSRAPIVNRARSNNHVDNNYAVLGAKYTSGKHFYEAGLWIAETDRGTPGSILSATPDASQYDLFFRSRLGYRYLAGNWNAGISAYSNRHQLDFFQPSSSIESLSEIQERQISIPVEMNVMDKFQVQWQSNLAQSSVETNNFDDIKKRLKISSQVAVDYQATDGTILFPSIRWDYYDDFGHETSYGLGLNQRIIPQMLHARIWAGKDFSAPTFNDLFWPNLGNEDLIPEQAYRMEFGTEYSSVAIQNVNAHIVFFAAKVSNGIQWLPGTDGRYRPVNIREIDISGLEAEVSKRYEINTLNLFLSAAYDFTQSQFGVERFPGDRSVGNQLPYVPKHKSRNLIRGEYENYSIQLAHQYTGQRFITDDNSRVISSYQTMDVAAGWNWSKNNFAGRLILNINNITNNDYQVMEWYPMPGRSITVTLNVRM